MFQKKAPGYRNGGGIAYLAGGGTSNTPVSGERTRILPRNQRRPGTAVKIVKGEGPRTINPGPQSRLNKIKNFGRKNLKGLGSIYKNIKGPAAVAAPLVYGLSAVTTNPELNFFNPNPIDPGRSIIAPTGAPLLGRGNDDDLIKKYVQGKEGYNPSIVAGKLRRGIATIGDYLMPDAIGGRNQSIFTDSIDNKLRGKTNILTGEANNPNAIDSLTSGNALTSREAFDLDIDKVQYQLGEGLTGNLGKIFAKTKAGEINTGKKISQWLESNRDKLFEMSTTDEESARNFINSLTSPDGLKNLIQKEDPEAFNEIFVGEKIAETTPIPEDFDFDKMTKDAQQGMGKVIEEERRKEALMQRARDNKSTMDTYIREERIQGKPMDPKVEEKALMAAMYGGGPNATAFDYFKNADVTRIAEEEKADKLRLEQKKALGSGYEAPKSEEVIEGTGINIAFFQPSNPTLRGAQELITDNAYRDASQQITTKLDVYARADDQINQLAAILEDGNPTSIGAKLKQGFSRAASALGTDFDQQTDSAKYASIQKLIQAAFTSEFLNESGRTISDRDRDLVRNIFADIDDLSATGTNIETLKNKLEAVREVITSGSKAYNSAFNRINLANPKMAGQFAQSNLTSEEQDELSELDIEVQELIRQQEATKNG